MKRYVILAAFIAIPLFIGGIGGAITADSVNNWYATLNKPPFNPPSWVFGPVWTVLYIFIGLAGYWMWERIGFPRHPFWVWYTAQLILNAIWSPIFFGMQNIQLALVVITAMLVSIAMTIRHAKSHAPAASFLLLPYLAWVAFATLLNTALVILN